MRKTFWGPFTIVLHLLIPREVSRGAAHTICVVNGDEGSGSHNMATSWDWVILKYRVCKYLFYEVKKSELLMIVYK